MGCSRSIRGLLWQLVSPCGKITPFGPHRFVDMHSRDRFTGARCTINNMAGTWTSPTAQTVMKWQGDHPWVEYNSDDGILKCRRICVEKEERIRGVQKPTRMLKNIHGYRKIWGCPAAREHRFARCPCDFQGAPGNRAPGHFAP